MVICGLADKDLACQSCHSQVPGVIANVISGALGRKTGGHQSGSHVAATDADLQRNVSAPCLVAQRQTGAHGQFGITLTGLRHAKGNKQAIGFSMQKRAAGDQDIPCCGDKPGNVAAPALYCL